MRKMKKAKEKIIKGRFFIKHFFWGDKLKINV